MERDRGSDGKEGCRWRRTKGKLGFHGGKIELERPRVRTRAGSEIALPSWEVARAEDRLGKCRQILRATLSATDEMGCGAPAHLIGERRSRGTIRSAPSVPRQNQISPAAWR